MPHIEIIEVGNAEGRLKEIYGSVIKKRGKLADVYKIQSLNPETILTHMDLYISIMFSQSPLSRAQREMIAVVVSAANGCEYCQHHHGIALNHYWKDETKVNALKKDINTAGIPEKDWFLCAYAKQLTLSSSHFEKTNFTAPLKGLGWSDREILDATLVIAYFNFVNRMVLGLGVKLESEGASGYKY